jgi:hypothetical protein
VTTGHFSSGAPEATQRKCCEPGPFYFAWGCFRDFVQALRWTAHSVSKTGVNTLAEALRSVVRRPFRSRRRQMECVSSISRDGRPTRCRTAQMQRQR